MTKEEKARYDRTRYEAIRGDPALVEKRRAQVRAAAIAYYSRNREVQIAKVIEWGKRNPEKRRELKRRYREKHRGRIIADLRRRYWENREANQAKSLAWYRANREYAASMAMAWRRANPDRVAHYANARRAAKASNGGRHSYEQWLELLEAFKRACFYCGASDRKLTRDHMVPLARGGSDEIGNIVPACRQCNAGKGVLTAEEYMARKEKEQ